MNSTEALILEGHQRFDRLVIAPPVFLYSEVQYVSIRVCRPFVGGAQSRFELIAAAERDDLAGAGNLLQVGPLRAHGLAGAVEREIQVSALGRQVVVAV